MIFENFSCLVTLAGREERGSQGSQVSPGSHLGRRILGGLYVNTEVVVEGDVAIQKSTFFPSSCLGVQDGTDAIRVGTRRGF